MKKTITLILLSLALVSCGRREDAITDIEEPEYYFEDVTDKMTLPPLDGARTFEILIKRNCWSRNEFDTQNTRIVSKEYPCEDTLNWNRFFRVTKEWFPAFQDWYYELVDIDVVWEETVKYNWRLSQYTF